ncbi:hypothetical protein [Blautia sp. MSJ-19]|uniref:hypothetical protein n=1 Tax=Blautia sp. MSJ-19 TaxID=2841517 RepID=UPI001C0ED452|nr:hypothetical protein [Blautia sp. MSJ-19]MBU5482615.1 hypothetical protein [Blautia sp. MSJ-19]
MKIINGIHMIPFGLLAGFADDKEIRITELARNGFQFRTVQDMTDVGSFRLCFYDDRKAAYREIFITDFILQKEQKEKFYTVYSVFTKQEDFKKESQGLAFRYSQYILLKMEEDDSLLAEKLTGYPAEEDEIFADNLEQQKKEWFQDVPVEKLAGALKEAPEFALELDHPALYEKYLKEDLFVFLKDYWVRNGFPEVLSEVAPDRLYIGNQFCHLLLPEEKKLFRLMEKTYREKCRITLVYTYIREDMLKTTEDLLEKVDKWCKERQISIEVVANDWAMVEMLKNYQERLVPVMGTLLNKRKKDPRMKYKKGDRSLYEENSLNAEFYNKFLREECNIWRYEWESCGYAQKFPNVLKGRNSLHFPFYQTNTSQYCPLYAMCTEGKRGKQELIRMCPHFCEQNALLYPKHLHMAGRYNSLFGVDTEVLGSPEKLRAYVEAGIDRLVLGLS